MAEQDSTPQPNDMNDLITQLRKSYTADTIGILREKYPEDELYLVVGTDMFLSFREWHEYKYLLDNCTLAVLSRETDDRGEILSFKRSLENEDQAHRA